MRRWLDRLRSSVAELTPEDAALLISVGLVLGVFPVSGCPTVFCLLAAGGLRLSAPGLQVVNQASAPLQWALLLPLARCGSWLCHGSGLRGAGWMGTLGTAAVHAVAGWACVCVPLGIVFYFALRTALRRRLAAVAVTA
jgi:hypothetical protein